MIKKISINDFKVVLVFVSRAIMGLGFAMLVPLVTSVIYFEWSAFFDFLISASVCLIFGYFIIKYVKTNNNSPSLFQAMLISAMTWLVACAFSAIPLYISGKCISFLDAYFDVMSGFTTSGLTLIQDIDHIGNALNMWRHMVTYIGGQGIIVLALTVLLPATGGAFKTMVAEGKDETLMPSIKNTANSIWIISLVSLAIGTLVLSIIAWFDGLAFDRGILHAMWMFMSAWSTGGFAPNSQNIIFYHSFLFEIGNMIFMIIGSFNFALHFTVWRGNVKELWKNIEILSFTFTASLCTFFVVSGMAKGRIFNSIEEFVRRGLFNVVSAHTTTGQMTLYPLQYNKSLADISFIGILLAMAIGGCMTSTAGGYKNMRIGLIFKSIAWEIKKLIAPESAIVPAKYHHLKDNQIDNNLLKQVFFVFICFTILYALSTFVGVLVGVPTKAAAFEAISASSNTGLTNGVTSPSMPAILKVTYIISMWLGRIEFMSAFVLVGTIVMWFGSLSKRRAR
jgi:trk system potassium uptake protein TrkH